MIWQLVGFKAYKQEGKKQHLLNAKEALVKIDGLVSMIRLKNSSDDSKLFWIRKGVDSYMLAVEVCYLLDDPESAFYFMEKNKSLLLLENIRVKQAELSKKLPDSIKHKIINYKQELLSLETAIRHNPDNESLKQAYSAKSINHQRFIDSLKPSFPEYHELIEQQNKISNFKEVRSKYCSTSSNFVEYIMNESNGYGIFCSDDKVVFFQIENIKGFQKKLVYLRNLMSDGPLLNKKSLSNYNSLAHYAFQCLFPFENSIDLIANKKLVIISDYKLRDLPFEALKVAPNPNDFSDNYLVNFSEISYLQSATVHKYADEIKRFTNNKILAIAPAGFKIDSLPKLERSSSQMESISKLFSSKLLVKEEATKSEFIKYHSEFSIVHLNTHAGYKENEKPWIAFFDETLTLEELYSLQNSADLIVLDACKTNTGKQEIGEGIMSLSRGFFQNGSKSVIATLWNSNEKANSEIFTAFYKELKKGKTRSSALNEAKKKYLVNHQNTEISPYYWAAITLTGNSDSISIKKDLPMSVLTLTLGLLVIIILVLFKLKS